LHEEEENIDIREKLLNLPKVKAGDDFLNALQRKINIAEAELNQKKISDGVKESFWVKLFGKNRNPWLIPSLSLTIVAIFVVSIYVLNTSKISDIPTMSDFRKKESPSGITSEDKRIEQDSKDKVTNQDIAGDLTVENKMDEVKSNTYSNRKISEQPLPTETLSPKQVLKPEEVTRPSVSEPVKNESGKVDYKKEDKIYQDMEKTVKDERVSPSQKEGNIKSIEENESKKNEETGKDVIESKGAIDRKDKSTMKKSVKNAVDSTKIDKKVLEKIKEEINKEK
jgi:hypothetical protein